MNKQPIAGKGSKPRPFTNYKDFTDRWDTINWGHKKKDNTNEENNNEYNTDIGRIKKNKRRNKRAN